MSWAWNEPVLLHLGHDHALVHTGAGSTRCVQFAATLPLARRLALVGDCIDAAGPRKPRKLRVSLAASISPVVPYEVPANVGREAHLLPIAAAAAAAAATFGTCIEDVACDVDPATPGVAAAVPVGFLIGLRSWAKQRKFAMASIAPLWVHASACALAATPRIQAVCVVEPESTTVIARLKSAWDGLTLPCPGVPVPGDGVGAWLAERAVAQQAVLMLRFHTAEQSPPRGVPRVLRQHWSLG